jgi:hypothetical protein
MMVTDETTGYEDWLRQHCKLDEDDLAYKHQQMSDPADPFPFFRGAYYLWGRRWAEVCPELLGAPRVLAVGDLHVENYGTWRDADGRLCWGVNDFDEADELPYAHDLVRLAASTRFARRAGAMTTKLGAASAAILVGYAKAIKAGGRPYVLEERHPHLRAMAMTEEPVRFWAKMTRLIDDTTADVPPPSDARKLLLGDLPATDLPHWFRFRRRAGADSLGKPRFVVIAEWAGGWVCREAKAITPPATAWVSGTEVPSRLTDAASKAVRSPDPFFRPHRGWVLRRLAPRCTRIELRHLIKARDMSRVLRAMGSEMANVHLGTPGAAEAVLADLAGRPDGWLPDAARRMARAIEADWEQWKTATTVPRDRNGRGSSGRKPRTGVPTR